MIEKTKTFGLNILFKWSYIQKYRFHKHWILDYYGNWYGT